MSNPRRCPLERTTSHRSRERMNLKKALFALPGMTHLWLGDLANYACHLYVRASWASAGLTLAPSALLIYRNRSHIQLDGNVSVGAFSVVAAIPTEEVDLFPLLRVGNNTYIGDQVNIRAAGGKIIIGRDVLIANHVTIVAANHGTKLGCPMIRQKWCRGDVTVGDDVWIGAGATILPGAVLRSGCVVAAGAVVRGEVPSGAVYGGIPAQQIAVRA